MSTVYVAGPYSSDPETHTRTAIEAGQRIADAGAVPFVPHLYHFWHQQIPGGYEQWMRLDLAWLSKCDALVRLPGESPGADREVAEAERLGLPVFLGIDAWEASEVEHTYAATVADREGGLHSGTTRQDAIESAADALLESSDWELEPYTVVVYTDPIWCEKAPQLCDDHEHTAEWPRWLEGWGLEECVEIEVYLVDPEDEDSDPAWRLGLGSPEGGS